MSHYFKTVVVVKCRPRRVWRCGDVQIGSVDVVKRNTVAGVVYANRIVGASGFKRKRTFLSEKFPEFKDVCLGVGKLFGIVFFTVKYLSRFLSRVSTKAKTV